MRLKKIVAAPDSFKGTISAIDICEIIKSTVGEVFPGCEVCALPAADGGEGTVESFLYSLKGERVAAPAHGPFMLPLQAEYALFGDTAVIEMAATAGLPLAGGTPDPLTATTYGVGEQIKHAVNRGAKKIILGLGGSATNDGGCGCACALGAEFFAADGNSFVPAGATLKDIARVNLLPLKEALAGITLTAMCDVDNPLYGENGAAHVFAPQKGADEEAVILLDAGLRKLADVIARETGKDVSQVPGAGAAGGLGAGVLAFLNGELKPGIEAVLDTADFDDRLEGADLVITGEGRIDGQSLRGKVVYGVARRAKKKGVPVAAIVGDVDDGAYDMYEHGVSSIFSINRKAVPFSTARLTSAEDYQHTLKDVLRLISSL